MTQHLTRRSFLRAAAGTALGAAATPLVAAQERRPPNIVFVLADDLGWAELGCYGNRFNETPHLDRLAREGMRFTDAYAAAPVCSPMRVSFMTGQYPARVGITDYLRPNDPKFLSPDLDALPKALGRAGYASCLIGKWHLMGDYAARKGDPKLHGFTEVVCSETRGIGGGDYWAPYRFNPAIQPRSEGEYLTDRLNREAVDFIERHRDKPLFLYLSHYAVHTRLDGKPPLVAKYKAKPGAGERGKNPQLAAMVESIDDGVGMVLAKLDELGIADNTVVIFMSDNGGEHRVTSNAPLRGAKSQLYEGGIREPLIVRWPGVVKPGSVCSTPVSSIDFYPTLLAMAGARCDPKHIVDGASLLPLLRGTGTLRERALFWHYPLARPHFLGGVSAGAVRVGDWKLIEFFDTGAAELYNLKDDIGETADLAAKRPDKVAELRKRLADWRASVGAVMPRPSTGLQLHLTFDEPAGAKRAKDSSGADRHLDFHGTTPAAGRKGQARRFDGKGDHLALPKAAAPNPAGKPIVISAWIRPEKPDGVILAHGGNRHGYALYLRGGRLAMAAAIDWKRTIVVAPDKLPGGWVHVAGRLAKDGAVTLFLNGKRVAKGKAAGTLVTAPGDSLEVGADLVQPVGDYEVPYPFGGLIDEIVLDYHLLSDADIGRNMSR